MVSVKKKETLLVKNSSEFPVSAFQSYRRLQQESSLPVENSISKASQGKGEKYKEKNKVRNSKMKNSISVSVTTCGK